MYTSDVPSQEPVSSHKKLFMIVGAGVCIAIVAIVVIYFVVKKQGTSPKEETPTENVAPPAENLQQTRFLHDQDRDGIEDTKEKELGTSDRNFDSDGDTLTDTVEIEVYQTDPTNPDTDGDGFWDGLEIIKGFNPRGEKLGD